MLQDIGDDARRQYMDAKAVFEAWETARKNVAEVRGGMYWKTQGAADYLIRTSPDNAQKSLGLRSAETEEIFRRFAERKTRLEARVSDLQQELVRQQRMNRALFVGRAPALLVDILRVLEKADLADHFTVVGTHALYAYEAAAGVRFEPEALATRDIDLLWDTRKRIRFVTRMRILESSMIGLLQKVDRTFQLRPDQRYTAVNSRGMEVDILRREAGEGDPHPLPLTDHDEDFFAVQARRAGVLLSGPRFSALVVTPSGNMARMNTVSPLAFARFKRWLANDPARDALKVSRDRRQAELVEQLVAEYLPQLSAPI